MSGLARALADAAARLADASPTARLDAELLAAHGLGIERGRMLLDLRDLEAPDGLSEMVERRMGGEPVQHITGRAEFWSLPLTITADTLIPRPDSETLIEAAERAFADREPPQRILDLGTGSGALLAAALTVFPRAAGLGIDVAVGAANVASGNMLDLGLAGRAEIRVADWTHPGWRDGLGGPFDLVLCNPPYIDANDAELADNVRRFEPESALIAGHAGLEHYCLLLPQLADLLAPGGVALFEIGHRQGEAVGALADDAGLTARVHHDLAGWPRAVEMSVAER